MFTCFVFIQFFSLLRLIENTYVIRSSGMGDGGDGLVLYDVGGLKFRKNSV